MIAEDQSEKDLLKLITIVTLSYERNVFLERYFEACGHNGFNTIVADGSKTVYGGRIPSNVQYFHLPDDGPLERLSFGLKQVTTPYTLFLADDDFVVPSALLKGVKFLQENPDYHSVQGRVLTFNELYTQSDVLIESYKGFDNATSIDYQEANIRLIKHMSDYVFTIYSLQRTSIWKRWADKIYIGIEDHPLVSCSSPSIFELTQSIHCVLSGKNKSLEDVFLIRENIPRPKNEITEGHLYFNETSEFEQYINILVKVLIKNLSLPDHVDWHSLLNEVFAIYAQKRRLNFSSAITQALGNIGKLKECFSAQRVELESITNIIMSYRTNASNMLFDGGLQHLQYWYDECWEQDIANNYQKKAQKLPHYVLYGAGIHTQMLFEIIGVVGNLVGVVDKNSQIWGTKIQEVSCYDPSEVLSLSENIVISSQQYEEEIERELKSCFGEKVNIIKLYN